MGYISNTYKIDPEKVANMVKDGIIDWRIEGLYDFWIFYNELLNKRESKKEAREEIMSHFNLQKRTFYRMIRKCKEIFE